MKCPHCLENFFESREGLDLGQDKEGRWRLEKIKCPACTRWVIHLVVEMPGRSLSVKLVHPKAISRAPLPGDVPDKYANDYKEACLLNCIFSLFISLWCKELEGLGRVEHRRDLATCNTGIS